jgi:hypothetical protein
MLELTTRHPSKRYLARGAASVRIIGRASIRTYRRYIEQGKAIRVQRHIHCVKLPLARVVSLD